MQPLFRSQAPELSPRPTTGLSPSVSQRVDAPARGAHAPAQGATCASAPLRHAPRALPCDTQHATAQAAGVREEPATAKRQKSQSGRGRRGGRMERRAG
eukprot:5453677-Pleurochrysis_carterae.AAC.1